jgi:hypothetical protein
VGWITRHAGLVATRETDAAVEAAGPPEASITHHGLCRVARRTHRLHICWVEIRTTATP